MRKAWTAKFFLMLSALGFCVWRMGPGGYTAAQDRVFPTAAHHSEAEAMEVHDETRAWSGTADIWREDDGELKVLTYNSQFRDAEADAFAPAWPNTKKRARAIGRTIACYDIIAIQEAFREDRRAQIIQAAEEAGVRCGTPSRLASGRIFDVATGPMVSPPLSYAPVRGIERAGKAIYNLIDYFIEADRHAVPVDSSGLLLLSRYPIIRVDDYTYNAKAGFDAWAKKGVLHAVVQRGERDVTDDFDIFITHLQAGHYRKERLSQVQELANFIQMTRSTSPDRPVLVLGDFNINGNSQKRSNVGSQYDFLDRTLREAVPTLIDLWPHYHTASLGYTNWRRDKRIDYIFLTEGVGVTSRAIAVNEFPTWEKKGVPFLSDHAGMEASLAWVR